MKSCIADEYTINTQWLATQMQSGCALDGYEQDLEQAENILSADFSDVLYAEKSVSSQDRAQNVVV